MKKLLLLLMILGTVWSCSPIEAKSSPDPKNHVYSHEGHPLFMKLYLNAQEIEYPDYKSKEDP